MSAEITSTVFGPGQELTPNQVLAQALGEAEEVETVVVIALFKDKKVRCGWSNSETLTRIGMANAASDKFLRELSGD